MSLFDDIIKDLTSRLVAQVRFQADEKGARIAAGVEIGKKEEPSTLAKPTPTKRVTKKRIR